ncbi:MAG: VanZ family protein [Coprococcus sp.]|nr:VanZ family protein [Coprococcus sp.]
MSQTKKKGQTKRNRQSVNNSGKEWLYAIPAALWMMVIFYMSSRTGNDSSAISNPITDFIVGLVQQIRRDPVPVVDNMTAVVEVMVRKGAHMAEYGILFALLYLAVKKIAGKTTDVYAYVWSLVITFAYACSDELHQLFVADRAGKGSDVIIDIAGAVLVLLFMIGNRETRGRIITWVTIALVCVWLCVFLLVWKF